MYALLLYESFLCFLQMCVCGGSCKICTSMCLLDTQNIHHMYPLKCQTQESWRSRYYQDIGCRKILYLLIPLQYCSQGEKITWIIQKINRSRVKLYLFFAKLCPQYFSRLCFKVKFLWKQTLKQELWIQEVNQRGTSKLTPVGEKEKLLSGKRETELCDSVPTKALVATIGSSESEWSLRQVWYKASLQSCII